MDKIVNTNINTKLQLLKRYQNDEESAIRSKSYITMELIGLINLCV